MRRRAALVAVTLVTFVAASASADDEVRVRTDNAIYELRDDPKNDEIKCVFRDGSRLTCIKRDLVMFGKPVRTRDYTIIPNAGSRREHSTRTFAGVSNGGFGGTPREQQKSRAWARLFATSA